MTSNMTFGNVRKFRQTPNGHACQEKDYTSSKWENQVVLHFRTNPCGRSMVSSCFFRERSKVLAVLSISMHSITIYCRAISISHGNHLSETCTNIYWILSTVTLYKHQPKRGFEHDQNGLRWFRRFHLTTECLAGWWFEGHPSEKYMSSSIGMIWLFPIGMGK